MVTALVVEPLAVVLEQRLPRQVEMALVAEPPLQAGMVVLAVLARNLAVVVAVVGLVGLDQHLEQVEQAAQAA